MNMTATEDQKQEWRTWYASVSDDILQNRLKNRSYYSPDEMDIVEEIWNSRLEEIKKICPRYEPESDEVLLNMLKNASFYPPRTITAVSTIWESRGYKLPDDFNPKQNKEAVVTDFRMPFGSIVILLIKTELARFFIWVCLSIIGYIAYIAVIRELIK